MDETNPCRNYTTPRRIKRNGRSVPSALGWGCLADGFVGGIGIRISLGDMHPAVDMVRRGVYSIDLEVSGSGIAEIVLGAGDYHDNIARNDRK
jgi:hypothetical protein